MTTVTRVRESDPDCSPWLCFIYFAEFTPLSASDDIGYCHRFCDWSQKAAPLTGSFVVFPFWGYGVNTVFM